MDRGTAAPGRAGGLFALLALVLVLGGATTVLSLRARHLASALPTHRIEPLVELGAVSAGALAALWVALSALVALVCVAARAAGRSWSTGERLLRRAAPGVVRHAARAAVGVTVGAGLLLAGGTAHAATTPADDPGVLAVDLGWRPSGADAGHEGTAPGGTAPESTASESTATTTRTPPGGAPAAEDGATAVSDAPSDAPAQAVPGEPAPAAPEPPSPAAPSPAAPSPVPANAGTSSQAPQGPARSHGAATTAPTDVTPSTAAENTGAWETTGTADAPTAGTGILSQGSEASGTAGPAVAAEGTSPDAARQRDAALAVTRGASGPQAAPEVVVVRGDSLWSIAARHLPAGSTDRQVAEAVERWYATNAHVVGTDADLVRPGQVLVAPPA